MTANRAARKLVIPALAVLLVLAACSKLPVQEVDLSRTTWQLATIDGTAVDTWTAPLVTFRNLDGATLHFGSCTADAALIVDTDGYGFGFLEPIVYSPDPCTDATSEARFNVATILTTESWSVLKSDMIELVGDHQLVFNKIA